MGNRVSASITIGGQVSHEDYLALAQLIADEGLACEWDGPPFEAGDHAEGEALHLFAHEVAGGRFDALEAKCRELGLAYARWSDGFTGEWGPYRVVCTSEGEPAVYPVDEDDVVVICREDLEAKGSLEAVYAWFDMADFAVPPLLVGGGQGSPAGRAVP
ncbi:hypothetical protein [uncultured Novosphingobium sp.]|uniref:hypothetical protein n=1 Tax=uncultured Novosphingobium sp. TaxID=292277 RepID=UPI0025926A6F|nr:hypothetical protein [uncultured Novosphingobium sp.]